MLAKFRSKTLIRLLAMAIVLGMAAWWWFRPPDFKGPAMILIPAGDFQMGDQSMPKVGNSDELPVHTVRVSAFLIGNCEVTKAEWDVVRDWGKDHGFTDLREGGGKAPNHPVQAVFWYDVVKWCNARSIKEGLKPCYTSAGTIYQTGEDDTVVCDWSADGYRLPTEAEWEKAARGGQVGKDYPWGDSISHSRANYWKDNGPSKLAELWNLMLDKAVPGRSRSSRASGFHPAYKTGYAPYTSPVASFPANGYGLHDMAGNVFEWCWDRYGSYPSSLQIDPRGVASGTPRVVRGGGWNGNESDCRIAIRYSPYPSGSDSNIGFRVARSSVSPTASR
jgi:formylglycine-generating enzyme